MHQKFVKRLLDLTFTLPALVVLSPVMLLVRLSWARRLSSSSSDRVGAGGPFRFYIDPVYTIRYNNHILSGAEAI